MRRHEREISDGERMDAFILSCDTVRLAFSDEKGAYVVPLSFGYRNRDGVRAFYFHGAKAGRKMDFLKAGGPIGFELDKVHRFQGGEDACSWTVLYESVIGTGTAEILEAAEEKAEALTLIMRHYTAREDWDFPESQLKRTTVFKLIVRDLSFKSNLPKEQNPNQ